MCKNTCAGKAEGLGPVVNDQTHASLEIISFLQQFDCEHIPYTKSFYVYYVYIYFQDYLFSITCEGSDEKNTNS